MVTTWGTSAVLALVLMALAAWTPAVAHAAGDELVVSAAAAVGDVSLALAGGEQRPLRPGETVRSGATVTAGVGATARLTFGNGVFAELVGPARLTLNLASRELIEGLSGETTCIKIAVTVESGRAIFRADNAGDVLLDFRVMSRAATALVRGTVLAVTVADGGETLVSVSRGGVDLVAGGRTIFVPEAFQSSVVPGGTPSPPMVWSESEEEIWTRAKDGTTEGE